MDVSIIIVNYNTLKLTSECIDSIIRQTKGVTYEIILVDNHSTDGSREYFLSDSRIRYIYNKENIGFGAANNIGFKASCGNFLFLLNSDTILLNNAVLEFFVCMNQLPFEVGCLGTMLVDVNGWPSLSYGKFPTANSSLRHLVFGEVFGIDGHDEQYFNYAGTPVEVLDVEYITGADIFVRREVAEQFGLFDTAYFLYYEETDMQRRYAKQGIRRCIITSPKIMHIEGGCSKTHKKVTLERICLPYESCFRFLRRWSAWYEYMYFKLLFVLIRVPHLLLNTKFSMRDKFHLLKISFL